MSNSTPKRDNRILQSFAIAFAFRKSTEEEVKGVPLFASVLAAKFKR